MELVKNQEFNTAITNCIDLLDKILYLIIEKYKLENFEHFSSTLFIVNQAYSLEKKVYNQNNDKIFRRTGEFFFHHSYFLLNDVFNPLSANVKGPLFWKKNQGFLIFSVLSSLRNKVTSFFFVYMLLQEMLELHFNEEEAPFSLEQIHSIEINLRLIFSSIKDSSFESDTEYIKNCEQIELIVETTNKRFFEIFKTIEMQKFVSKNDLFGDLLEIFWTLFPSFSLSEEDTKSRKFSMTVMQIVSSYLFDLYLLEEKISNKTLDEISIGFLDRIRYNNGKIYTYLDNLIKNFDFKQENSNFLPDLRLFYVSLKILQNLKNISKLKLNLDSINSD